MKFRPTLAIVLAAAVLRAGAVLATDAAEADGAKIYEETCASCHATGLMGAPKIGDASDWQARFKSAGSVAGLLETTKHGKGNMPPRGGEASLSDAEIQAAVRYMLDKSGVPH